MTLLWTKYGIKSPGFDHLYVDMMDDEVSNTN